jgi:methionyl-tRNA synthetase
MAKFYLTSAIPYVNARPHIGWALEIVQADAIVRYRRLQGDETLYLCGSDENSLKNVQAAEKAGKPVQEFVDEFSTYFVDLAKNLNVKFDVFQRGSNPQHHTSAQALWKKCFENGDIYKKQYTGLYCVGCEMFYTKEELNENGECFEHPGKKLDEVQEENYFFKLSTYREELIQLISSNTLAVVPEFRKNEILSFLKGDLEDISISRSNERAKNWGVTVPGDESQKMYVWFDALNIYQSGVGFGWNEEKYKKWWPADIHAIGKGIIRFHAVYWPAFLISAKLPLPKKLFVHEYITVNGQKMSKSLGNVIDPQDFINKYGTDALRYYLLAKISPFQDGDFSDEKFIQSYNADLANGLGNLIARVAKLSENAGFTLPDTQPYTLKSIDDIAAYSKSIDDGKFNEALNFIWEKIGKLDKYINDEKPWLLAKTDPEKLKIVLEKCVSEIQQIAVLLEPFMPQTAEKIAEQFKGPKIVSNESLFPRLSTT